MLKLFRMKDPLIGVITLKFTGPCHINADVRPISTKSGPDFSTTHAE
jgi:hypothetical protein